MSLLTNLVSYYRLDGNSNDAVGANNGSDTNISYSAGNGKINNGAGFNGTSSRIAIGTSLTANYTGLTMAGWFNTGATGAYRDLLRKTDSATYNLGMRMTNANVLEGFVATSGAESYITGGTALS